MPDRPIIFSAPMVRALLDGRKTQTRRVLKPQPEYCGPGRSRDPQNWADPESWGWENHETGGWDLLSEGYTGRPYYAPGDRLWVREAFLTCEDCGYLNHAEGANNSGTAGRSCCASCDAMLPKAKRSPIHMPRWASRITLTVTDVRVKRAQEISEDDARAEGAKPDRGGGGYSGMYGRLGLDPHAYSRGFKSLWTSIHGLGAWDANPWVAAITFTVRKGNIDHDR